MKAITLTEQKKLEEVNNKIDILETKLGNLDSRFQFFGNNLTSQLQRQEERALKSWVSFHTKNLYV